MQKPHLIDPDHSREMPPGAWLFFDDPRIVFQQLAYRAYQRTDLRRPHWETLKAFLVLAAHLGLDEARSTAELTARWRASDFYDGRD
jgi:hypothetical protein